MLKEFEYWLKTPDTYRSLFFLKKILRSTASSAVWNYAPLRLIRDYVQSWQYVNYHILSVDPLIILDVWQHGYFRELSAYLPKEKNAYFICLNWWHLESDHNVKMTQAKYLDQRRRYPRHHIFFLCNSMNQKELFDRYHLPSIYCNQNALLDEDRYRILPQVHKEFDAIYLAVAAPFKRHQLACEIESLALIMYFASFSKSSYVDEIKRTLPQAIWLIDPEPLKNYIPGQKIGEYLNLARTGLCLSAAEGAMYASAEYLLCGLPVVTTRSRGGRDVFFDDDYTMTVDDDPRAVRLGVQELIARRIPCDEIRARTLTKIQPHRQRFIRLVQDIYNRENVDRRFEKEWDQIFVNKMLTSRRLRCLRDDIRRRKHCPNHVSQAR